jgi:hypothetical protein
MKLSEIVKALNLEVCCGDYEIDVQYGCVGDLLSEVMAHAKANSIWVTVQSHVNIVAVSVITGIRAIVLCNAHSFSSETIEKAKAEGICLLRTDKSPFEIVGRLYGMGIEP